VLFLILLSVGQSACHNPDAVLQRVFDDREMVMVNRIIDYYDSCVWSQTDRSLPLKQAYRQFLDKNCPVLDEKAYTIIPPKEEVIHFFGTLDREAVYALFTVRDTFYLYHPRTGELVRATPYNYRIQPCYKYTDLLKILSTRSEFFAAYHKKTLITGNVSLVTHAVIYQSYPEDNPGGKYLPYKADFDFSKKEERFTCIIALLFAYDYI
jgi:hypothetical protein